MTVRSLSEMMRPDVVGSAAGCETCGNNDVKTTVTRVAVENLAKINKPKALAQPATAITIAAKPQAQPQQQKPIEKRNG